MVTFPPLGAVFSPRFFLFEPLEIDEVQFAVYLDEDGITRLSDDCGRV
jgi:mannose-6-phosphate isomerase-like protein (cupin superfamily)